MFSTRILLQTLPRAGRVEWIGVAPVRRAPIESVRSVLARPGSGLDGDHHAKRGGKRQVTLIQWEHLAVIASLIDRDHVDPALLRRNIGVSGINLLALRDRRFRLGEAVLEGTGPCEPCSRMEEIFGPGGFNAVRGHGGICARVVEEGEIAMGARLQPV